MEEGCKNHKETIYSSRGKIVWGNPVIFVDFGGKPYDNFRTSPQSVN